MVSTIVSNHLEQKYNQKKKCLHTLPSPLSTCSFTIFHQAFFFLLPPNGGQKIHLISLHRRRFLGAWGGSLSTVTCRFLTSSQSQGILRAGIPRGYPATTQDASHKWRFRLGFPILKKESSWWWITQSGWIKSEIWKKGDCNPGWGVVPSYTHENQLQGKIGSSRSFLLDEVVMISAGVFSVPWGFGVSLSLNPPVVSCAKVTMKV